MRDRLIELMMNAPKLPITNGGRAHGKTYQTFGNIADHLLAEGVIVQVKGRWVTEGKIFYCSNCRFTRNIEVYINHRYCPHCGAKMERSNENAE
jgi:hypothetical protein